MHKVVWRGRKPAHDHAAKFDGVDSEADRFNQFWSDVVTEVNSATFIANSFQNSIMHDVFAPEKLMYIGGRPSSVESKGSPVRSLRIFP